MHTIQIKRQAPYSILDYHKLDNKQPDQITKPNKYQRRKEYRKIHS